MSFLSDTRTLRISRTYSQISHLKMSVNTENAVEAFRTRGAEEIDGNMKRISLELTEDSIRVNLEHSNEQIATLTQFLIQLIQNSLAKTTINSYAHNPQTGLLLKTEAGASRTSPDTAIGGTGLSPDIHSDQNHSPRKNVNGFFSIQTWVECC